MVDEYLVDIVTKAAQGNKEAFSRLVEVFTPMLRSIARCYLNEYFDIEDVLQDVWIKIYTNLDTLREPEKFKSWIAKIMRYHCIKACKTQRAIHGRQLVLDIEERHDLIELYTSGDEIAFDLEKMELKDIIEDILSKIPEMYAVPLKLYYIENMSVKEIGHVLALNDSTVKWRLYQGRSLFRKLAGEQLLSGYIRIRR